MERSFRGSTWGPLGEHAEGFFAELAGLGYSRRGRSAHLRLMKDVSEWLGAQGLSAGDLTAEVVAELVAVRREGCSTLRSAKALLPLLSYLRRQGATPMPPAKAPVEASEIMVGAGVGGWLPFPGTAFPCLARRQRWRGMPRQLVVADRQAGRRVRDRQGGDTAPQIGGSGDQRLALAASMDVAGEDAVSAPGRQPRIGRSPHHNRDPQGAEPVADH